MDMKNLKTSGNIQGIMFRMSGNLGPVVQSIVSLKSSLRGHLLRVLQLYYQIY